MISKGRNVSEFFAQVVKNVTSHNLEIHKLVYLLRCAEQEPDPALLSIQNDLSDPNPLIRAMTLRVLSGIKTPMIASIVIRSVRQISARTSAKLLHSRSQSSICQSSAFLHAPLPLFTSDPGTV